MSSPRLVIDTATGEIVQRIDYDEYGNILQDTNPGFIPFGFGAGMYDQHTKLLRFGARDYDTHAGRWTAKDPARFSYGEWNMYAYVGNEPVNRVDPTGLVTLTGDCCGKHIPIAIRIEKACNNLSVSGTVKGRNLRDCIKDRCDNGSIQCVKCPESNMAGYAELGTKDKLGKKAALCANNEGMRYADGTAIHEFAHTCGWGHPKIGKPDPHNIPNDPWRDSDKEIICPSCSTPSPFIN